MLRVKVSRSRGGRVAWCRGAGVGGRNGKELFYLAEDNTLMAVPVKGTGSKFEIGTARPLFRTNPSLLTYDVSPDGNRFIVLTAAPEATAPITLVENWPSDFKK